MTYPVTRVIRAPNNLQDCIDRMFTMSKYLYQNYREWRAQGVDISATDPGMFLLLSGPQLYENIDLVSRTCCHIGGSTAGNQPSQDSGPALLPWLTCFLHTRQPKCRSSNGRKGKLLRVQSCKKASRRPHPVNPHRLHQPTQITEELLHAAVIDTSHVNDLQLTFLAVEGCAISCLAAGCVLCAAAGISSAVPYACSLFCADYTYWYHALRH